MPLKTCVSIAATFYVLFDMCLVSIFKSKFGHWTDDFMSLWRAVLRKRGYMGGGREGGPKSLRPPPLKKYKKPLYRPWATVWGPN